MYSFIYLLYLLICIIVYLFNDIFILFLICFLFIHSIFLLSLHFGGGGESYMINVGIYVCVAKKDFWVLLRKCGDEGEENHCFIIK